MTDEIAKEVTDLVTIGEVIGTMDRPKSLDPNDLSGTEGIGPQDVRLPRLATAQGLSTQMTPGDGQYIEGLKLFDMFNDLTEEVYGRGPITFVPVRRDVRRIEFIPRSEGGGIVDMDVPPNDPRLAWTVAEDGARVPPAATTFVEFVILMLRPGKAPEPIVLSIKGTNKFNRRASDQLTTFIKLRHAPIYAGLYTVTGGQEKNDKGTFGVPVIKNAGFIPKDTPAGAALYAYAEEFHRSLEGKTIVVEREPGSDDEFVPEEATTEM
ncbi:MAG: hypothetical protein NUV51_04530 [Sulfuricaulis sp.]|nr:hypothetical protein [Sulfuricaulis sp.]